MVSPQIKVTSSRGYAPRLTAESSIKKREHINGDEETLDAYNRLLSSDATAWTDSRESDTAQVDLSQNASSSSMGKVDLAGEAMPDILEEDLQENLLLSVTMGEVDVVDQAWAEEDIFEVDLSALHNAPMGKVDAVDEAAAEGDVFEVDLSRVESNSSTMGMDNVVDEGGAIQDTFEVVLLGNGATGATYGEVDVVDDAWSDEMIFEVDSLGNTSSSATDGEVDVVDEAWSDEVTFEQDLLGNASSNATHEVVDVVEEAWASETTIEVDLFGNSSSSATYREVNAVDEARADEVTFAADSLENASSSAMYGEVDVLDDVRSDEAAFEVDVFENSSSSATYGEVNVIDEVQADEVTFAVDSSENASSSTLYEEVDVVDQVRSDEVSFAVDVFGNTSSSATYGEVDVVGEDQAKEVTFEADLSRNTSSTAGQGEEDEVEGASTEKETFDMVFLTKHVPVDSVTDDIGEDGTYQQQYLAPSSISVGGKTIDERPTSLKLEPTALVKVQVQDKSISSVHQQEGSVLNLHEHNQPMVDLLEQEQKESIAFDEQEESIARVPIEDKRFVDFPQQKLSISGTHRNDQSIVAFPFPNESIVTSHKEDQSVAGSHEQDKSIVGVPEQTQSTVASTKHDQSIVGYREQEQSIVSAPEQKQSIVGFRKQDLSIVGVKEQNLSIVGPSREGQTNQVAIVQRHDALMLKGEETKDGDYTSEKTDGDVLHGKFDVGGLSQKHKAGITEAVEMTTSKKADEKHLTATEDQLRISATEEQWMVTKEGFSAAEEDELKHGEEELSWVEDEMRIIGDVEQHELDGTSLSSKPDVQESPQDYVDPQALRMMLQELADRNDSMGNKLFVFPEVVKANSVIDLYLNRSLSTLANEPDVLIKGAFNGWRWKAFTERLNKSELGGDWWCCKIHIPEQTYRLDFVFFNSRLVYENNGNNDFMVPIESTVDEESFENFLVEEKQRELERLASEEAERKRQTEEQRRRKEERAADEAARAQAKAEVESKKKKLHSLLGLGRTHVDNLWYIEPSAYKRGDTVRLYYNRNSRPLVHSTEIWMHGGCNNWSDGLSIVERLIKCDDKSDDWWYADVNLPEQALLLDWVFADGPPGNARNYDNNGRQDFHAILSDIITDEKYWEEEEHRIYIRLLQERREQEEATKRKAEERRKKKSEMKEKTMRTFLLSQKHIVYTEPLEIHAGTTVDVLYNPSSTVLNGKPEVWFRWSFNRWTHTSGVLPPQRMVKAEDGWHLKATVKVPRDAYMMDFVFSESEEGGIYDNRNGTDYHIPVSGSIAKEPPIHIVHIAVEMAPIAKVGGLGDVVTSLSRAVQDLGHRVDVILPLYDCMNKKNVKNLHLHQSFSWGGTEIKVWLGIVEDLSVYFLEPQNGMFGVGCVYGRNDDRRFGFFCHSALEFLLQSGSSPYIIHCHDWTSAPVAWLYKEHYAESMLSNARVVFTIHNLEFGAHYIGKAMTYCDKATTVSRTYSKEVAGHGVIRPHLEKFYGILNGIDPDIWDPYTDNFIPVNYTSENVDEGKRAAKKALQQKFGLQQNDVPIVGIISRLTAQKGIHLIKHAIHRTLERGGQVVLLGSAPDHRIQSDFCRLADSLHGENHGRVKLCLTYDEPLSHLIYAGSDFILVPSIFEPCGLTQLVAMRYGSIPIVRKTGGLYDTVFDVDHDKDRARVHGLEPNGFSFDAADGNGVDYGLNRALSAWFDGRDWFRALCKRVMDQDWSWNRPALDYIELYHSAHKL